MPKFAFLGHGIVIRMLVKDLNEKFYGKEEVSVKEIFNNEVAVPDGAKELIKLLEKYCKETE